MKILKFLPRILAFAKANWRCRRCGLTVTDDQKHILCEPEEDL
jgi:rubrerythrin